MLQPVLYKVIFEKTLLELTAEVNFWLTKGYELQGGVVLRDTGKYKFFQTLIKK